MLDALHFPPDDPFRYWELPNPALQRHYQVLEALALGEEPPSEIVDHTVATLWPAGRKDVQDAIWRFQETLAHLPSGKGGKAEAAKKRKAPEGDKTLEDKLASIDFKAKARDGTLSQLTNDMLKAYLQYNGLPKGGNKAELVQRIVSHVDGEQGLMDKSYYLYLQWVALDAHGI
eukprot:jgi/Botrbrau1/7126/Bobra.0143s0006.1